MALKVALTWAVKRYRGRLTSGLEDQIRSLLNFSDKLNFQPAGPVVLNLHSNEEFPPLSKQMGNLKVNGETRVPRTGQSSPCVLTGSSSQAPGQAEYDALSCNNLSSEAAPDSCSHSSSLEHSFCDPVDVYDGRDVPISLFNKNPSAGQSRCPLERSRLTIEGHVNHSSYSLSDDFLTVHPALRSNQSCLLNSQVNLY